MKFQCKDLHMANKTVTINGNSYKLDAKCIIKVTEEADIERLKKIPSWNIYVEREPVSVPDKVEPVVEAKKEVKKVPAKKMPVVKKAKKVTKKKATKKK